MTTSAVNHIGVTVPADQPGEVPHLTPGGSWLLIGCLVATAVAYVARGVANGPDELGEASYDDRVTKPWPPAPVDHEACDSDDCDLVLCYCDPTDPDGPCPGTVDPGCTHPGVRVCDDHRLSDCGDCLLDARHDAGWMR